KLISLLYGRNPKFIYPSQIQPPTNLSLNSEFAQSIHSQNPLNLFSAEFGDWMVVSMYLSLEIEGFVEAAVS
ncbi:hypothetical protein MKW92_041156, partial [Papaver armeniacum]